MTTNIEAAENAERIQNAIEDARKLMMQDQREVWTNSDVILVLRSLGLSRDQAGRQLASFIDFMLTPEK